MKSMRGTVLGVLAGAACVACCTLPVLIAGGLLSGAAAAFLADAMPLIAIVLTALALLAFGLAARRRAASGCGDSCSTSPGQNGCGCTPARH